MFLCSFYLSLALPVYLRGFYYHRSWQVFLCSFYLSLALPVFLKGFYYHRSWQVFLCSFYLSLALPVFLNGFYYHRSWQVFLCSFYLSLALPVFLKGFIIIGAGECSFGLFICHLPCQCSLRYLLPSQLASVPLLFLSLTCLATEPLRTEPEEINLLLYTQNTNHQVGLKNSGRINLLHSSVYTEH